MCDGCIEGTFSTWQNSQQNKRYTEVARKAKEKCLNEMAKKPTLKRPC